MPDNLLFYSVKPMICKNQQVRFLPEILIAKIHHETLHGNIFHYTWKSNDVDIAWQGGGFWAFTQLHVQQDTIKVVKGWTCHICTDLGQAS